MSIKSKLTTFFGSGPNGMFSFVRGNKNEFEDDLVTFDTVMEVVKSAGYVPEPAIADFNKVMAEFEGICLVAILVEKQYIPSVIGAQVRDAVKGFKIFKVKALLQHLSDKKIITNTRLLRDLGIDLVSADNSAIFDKVGKFIPEKLHDQFKRLELKIDDTVYQGEIVDED